MYIWPFSLSVSCTYNLLGPSGRKVASRKVDMQKFIVLDNFKDWLPEMSSSFRFGAILLRFWRNPSPISKKKASCRTSTHMQLVPRIVRTPHTKRSTQWWSRWRWRQEAEDEDGKGAASRRQRQQAAQPRRRTRRRWCPGGGGEACAR